MKYTQHCKVSMSLSRLQMICLMAILPLSVVAFSTPIRRSPQLPWSLTVSCSNRSVPPFRCPTVALGSTPDKNDNNEIKFNRDIGETITNLDEDKDARPVAEGTAATNTVNERLLAELKAAENKERFGARSSAGKKMGMVDGYGRSRKSDEEIQAAIAKARDLNGVNPVVCLMGGIFALAAASGLWYGTLQLGNFFALHPIDTEVYFVVRASQVVRNVAMGLISLASGFFGVTGLGIFGLGVRVAYGVTIGELDPTPIKQNQKAMAEVPNVWDLMMGKKPTRRSRGGSGSGNDNNHFGI